MKKLFIICIAGLLMTFYSCKTNNDNSIQFLNITNDQPNKYPFSKAVKTGNLLFLAGQIGKDPKTGKLVKGGIENQTKQVMENIKSVLEANGTSLDKVVKCTVILDSIEDFSAMNSIYKTYFNDNYPARTTFAANLVGGAKIEIEAIAVVE
ncbi:RidA family protein [Aureibaculum conchae]|uniref:RidA family protein n=1 Tax=Aureibaculum sp. 2308TA14-22 TaxID=3108392 RepID=UPI0033932624